MSSTIDDAVYESKINVCRVVERPEALEKV